jgi:hypothetical protein
MWHPAFFSDFRITGLSDFRITSFDNLLAGITPRYRVSIVGLNLFIIWRQLAFVAVPLRFVSDMWVVFVATIVQQHLIHPYMRIEVNNEVIRYIPSIGSIDIEHPMSTVQ